MGHFSNLSKLIPKLTQSASHFLPGHQKARREDSRKTISSPILDHKMSISELPIATSILLEKNLKHHWNWSKAGKDPKRGYFVPNFGRDSDINDSISHLNQAQSTLGTWDLPKDDWF